MDIAPSIVQQGEFHPPHARQADNTGHQGLEKKPSVHDRLPPCVCDLVVWLTRVASSGKFPEARLRSEPRETSIATGVRLLPK